MKKKKNEKPQGRKSGKDKDMKIAGNFHQYDKKENGISGKNDSRPFSFSNGGNNQYK